MDLLRPLRTILPENDKISHISATREYPYSINDNGLTINKLAHVLYLGKPSDDGWSYVTTPAKDLSLQELEYYNRFEILINHAANAGEAVNVTLRNLLCRIVDNDDVCRRLSKLSFARQKGALSDFFHSFTPMKNQENYNTKSKRSRVTKTLSDFIEDRNIYTHGQLLLLKPSNDYIIRYLDMSNGKNVEAVVDEKVVQSYLDVSNELILFLNEIRGKYYQQPINKTKLVTYIQNSEL